MMPACASFMSQHTSAGPVPWVWTTVQVTLPKVARSQLTLALCWLPMNAAPPTHSKHPPKPRTATTASTMRAMAAPLIPFFGGGPGGGP